MSASPKFLITGASGFVGRHLIEEVVARHGATAVTALVPAPVPASERAAVVRFRELSIEVLEVDLLRLQEAPPKRPDFDVLIHLAGYAVTEDASGPFAVKPNMARVEVPKTCRF